MASILPDPACSQPNSRQDNLVLGSIKGILISTLLRSDGLIIRQAYGNPDGPCFFCALCTCTLRSTSLLLPCMLQLWGGGVGVVQLPRRMRSDAEDPSDDERGRTPTRAEAWRKQLSDSPIFLPSERQLCPALNLKVPKALNRM